MGRTVDKKNIEEASKEKKKQCEIGQAPMFY